MKRIIALLLALIVACSLCACGKEQSAAKMTVKEWESILNKTAESANAKTLGDASQQDTTYVYWPGCWVIMYTNENSKVHKIHISGNMSNSKDDMYTMGIYCGAVIGATSSGKTQKQIFSTLDLDNAFTGQPFERSYNANGVDYSFNFTGSEWTFGAVWADS